MSERIAVCNRDDLASGEVRRFEVGGRAIALVRIEDDFYALGDRCSHEERVSLSEGDLWADERESECPRARQHVRPQNWPALLTSGDHGGPGL